MICFSARDLLGWRPSRDAMSVPTQSMRSQSWVTAISCSTMRSKWYVSSTWIDHVSLLLLYLQTNESHTSPLRSYAISSATQSDI